MKQLRVIATVIFILSPWLSEAQTKSALVKGSGRVSKELAEQNLLVELTGKDFSKENDIALYAEMVSAYNSNDEIAFKSRLQSMMTRFPQSSYADNALFLAGSMAAFRNNYAEALKYFVRIEKEYPRSNKVAAAKFAKAMTYKKMNLPEFATNTLAEVRTRYPGSPEAFRASAELKLLK